MDPKEIIEVFRRNVMEHYFDMSGRVSRKEFWYFVLACVVLYLGAAIIGSILFSGLLTSLLGLALLLPTMGMGARRLQDIGRNGQLMWVWAGVTLVMNLIGLFGAITGPFGALGFLVFFLSIGWIISLAMLVLSVVLIYFWVQPGTAGPNEFGPDPLATEAKPA
jgi:uncharacterized membrane protein YhaH (DUF805 family)